MYMCFKSPGPLIVKGSLHLYSLLYYGVALPDAPAVMYRI